MLRARLKPAVWPESTVPDAANVAQVHAAIRGRSGPMAKNFITGRAQSVSNSVQRVADLRKSHPEWDVPPSPKSLARERPTRHAGDRLKRVFFKNALYEVVAEREQ